jgi:serine/threonine protein kinase
VPDLVRDDTGQELESLLVQRDGTLLRLEETLDKGALPSSEALAPARQIALALEAAHWNGVVHREPSASSTVETLHVW